MIDSNVIYSAFFFPDKKISNMVKHIKKHHEIVLCKYIINETCDVVSRDANQNVSSVKTFMESIADEVFQIGSYDPNHYPKINDPKDTEILVCAIESEVDILITGDTDFDVVNNIERPRILKPKQYMSEFM